MKSGEANPLEVWHLPEEGHLDPERDGLGCKNCSSHACGQVK